MKTSVRTLADLEALPVGARFIDRFGDVLTKISETHIGQYETKDMPLHYVAKHWLPGRSFLSTSPATPLEQM